MEGDNKWIRKALRGEDEATDGAMDGGGGGGSKEGDVGFVQEWGDSSDVSGRQTTNSLVFSAFQCQSKVLYVYTYICQLIGWCSPHFIAM